MSTDMLVASETKGERKAASGARDREFQTSYTTSESVDVDVTQLKSDLEELIRGEVRFDDGARALYSTDASNYRQIPIGVVLPRSEEDILHTIAVCRRHHAPLLSRGAGTSLAGQSCNVAVIMDMSRYFNKILHIDKERQLVDVQPGVVLDVMRGATEEQAGLTFGPDPATHRYCTLGGMLGNNSCGVHSVMSSFYGHGATTADNTESLTIVTYDGVKMEVGATPDEVFDRIVQSGGRRAEIYRQLAAFRDKYADLIRKRFPGLQRRVSGYNLPALLPENGFNVARALVGSESTCVTILEAKMKLVKKPPERSLVVLGYPDIFAAGDDVPEILRFKPVGLEGIDQLLITYMKKKGLHPDYIPLLPEGSGWLMVEFGGDTREEASEKGRKMMDDLKRKSNPPSMKLFEQKEEEEELWTIRESGLGATAWVPGEPMSVPGWEDSAVKPEMIGDYLRDLRNLFNKYGYEPSLYGHFGQGCVHCRVQFDLVTAEGLQKYKQFTVEAADLVVKYHGSLSGEHGDGQARGDLLEIMYGSELVQAFREFKAIWDPEGRMNPGKVIDTYGQLSNLRLDNRYNPPKPETNFQFPDDGYDFSRAALRCVGVGKCRQNEGGTMCPSYMVTHEEEHTTRGRARMLFEMLQGNPIANGWKDEHVKESLDLCLACKGCKGDCPVHVDMATYKSEFLSHYFEGRLRPSSAYAFGWVYWWARLASLAPRLVNFLTHTPVVKDLFKSLAGVAPERELPLFSEVTFREWFANRQRNRETTRKPKVILWADTFNNFFLPETLVAGVEVLEMAGFEVVVPARSLCCGRPLYDFGMLKTAKRMLVKILETLQPEIEKGTPVVGLEPSCVAVFRDELISLLPHNENAKRLSKNVFTLGEFLMKNAPDLDLPKINGNAVVHGHCHHKAIMKMDDEKDILKRTGVSFELLDSGCCGMAGYFGYEKGSHYDVSIKAGERVLLPAVRHADPQCLIIADGFSCREQIAQLTERKAVHTAQVIQMALREGNAARVGPFPERKYIDEMKLRDTNRDRRRVRTLITLAVVAGVVMTTGLLMKKD